MREIKFRVWHKTLCLMIYEIIIDPDGWHTNMGEMFGYGHEFVMQYTGLKDKKGRKIYEGDIVEVKIFKEISGAGTHPDIGPCRRGAHSSGSCPHGKKYDVAFIDSCFELYDSGGGYACDLKQVYSISEVIGNIYENPELLETK